MTDKLEFQPDVSNVILDFTSKISKLTPHKEIDIALRILEKQHPDDLKKYFVPLCNEMIEEKMKDYTSRPQADFPVGIPFPPPESS